VLGVDPELNPASMYDATRLAEMISAIQGPPDDDSRALTGALLGYPLLEVQKRAGVTRAEVRNAERQVRFTEAMCRHLVGDELADALGVRRTSWRLAVAITQRIVRGVELVRTSVPSVADGAAIAAGSRYWDRAIEVGLAGATAEFALPDRLAAA
jgi:hypothetical protein